MFLLRRSLQVVSRTSTQTSQLKNTIPLQTKAASPNITRFYSSDRWDGDGGKQLLLGK